MGIHLGDVVELRGPGLRRRLAAGTAIISAWVPSRVKPTSPPVPQTSAPIHSAGPASTTPAKSRPGMRGNVVCFIAPATFLTSLGFDEAASVGVNYMAAWLGVEAAGLKAGETVLLIGRSQRDTLRTI